MPLITSPITAHKFTGLQDLDDVLLYIDTPQAGKGRITIACFTCAWTVHFSDLGEHESPADRFLSATVESLITGFLYGTPEVLHRERAKETAYLRHILGTVRADFAKHLASIK